MSGNGSAQVDVRLHLVYTYMLKTQNLYRLLFACIDASCLGSRYTFVQNTSTHFQQAKMLAGRGSILTGYVLISFRT